MKPTKILFLTLLVPFFAWAEPLLVTNPVTGEDEEYLAMFTSEESDEWNNAGNWYFYESGQAKVPFVSGGVYLPTAVVGTNAVTTTQIEGWKPQVGAYYGANIEWRGGINKVQTGDVQGGFDVCWLTADEFSKITIASFGGGQLSGTLAGPMKLTSASAGGITWNGDIKVSGNVTCNLPFMYYLGGEGSVVYGGNIFAQTQHIIKMADVKLTGGAKQVRSKTLVSFASSVVQFAAATQIKLLDSYDSLVTKTWLSTMNTIGETTLTTESAVGECELVQTSTGVLLYWVDGEASDVVDELDVGENGLLIELDGDKELTLNSTIEYGKVAVTGIGTLTLAGEGKITAQRLFIDRNVTVAMDQERISATTVTGSGTALYDGAIPETGKGWTDATSWTGTVWLRDKQGITGNNNADTGVQPNSLGNASSSVKFSGVSGWLEAPVEYEPEIILENDGFDYALMLTNGNSPAASGNYSNRATTVTKLSGSGTLCSGGTSSANPALKVYDASDFAGSIDTGTDNTGLIVVFCGKDTILPGSLGAMFIATDSKRTIYVAPGAKVTVGESATWKAKTGITVDGELVARSLDAFDDSTVITTSDTGVFTLKNNADTKDHEQNFARITGSGTLRYADVPGYWRTLSPTNYPTAMVTENNLSAGLVLTVLGENVIGSLAGDGGIRSDWGGTSNVASRTLKILQSKDTEYSGLFRYDDRISSVTVAPGESTAGTLTLSGEQTVTNDLIIAEGASVNLTGVWKGDVTVAGTLHVASGAVMAGNLVIEANGVLDIVTDGAGLIDAALDADEIAMSDGSVVTVDGEQLPMGYKTEITGGSITIVEVGIDAVLTHDCVLRISEIMPKPTDDLQPGEREGMDVNGLESGWVEVENTSDMWADLADYRFTRTNRGKKSGQADYGNFPSRYVPPRGRAIFYTSERYSNSKDKTVSAFEEGTFNGKPMIFESYGNILVWGDKVNPKKSPFVRLYHMPNAATTNVVDTVVIPSDIPEGWSIIVGEAEDGEGTRRWLCPTPTRGTENTATDSLVRIGPNVGPLYEISSRKKTDVASEFARAVPPAKPGEDYVITLPINPVMNPDGTFTPRAADEIQSIKLVYRKNLDDTTLTTNDVSMTETTDKKAWGDQYTATIPASYFPEAGHLMQWKVLITDGEGVEWTSPSFNNPDDGYEWYGTIVEAPELESEKLSTWHMFAAGNHLAQMDVDKDKQNLSLVPNYARIAIYDSSTSNYYDYVRIDLRGNTSAGFRKKGHGLRFAKAHPLTMRDAVTGEEIEEIRKTSLISEFADPSYMRQMIAFWLWRKMGNLVPFDFPVRCNLNGEFYQLAFNSERFTDELIEDVYGLDKFGYGYKNVGTLNLTTTTAGKIEKKTPDDEDETNIYMLTNSLVAPLRSLGAYNSHASEESTALTKFVVEKFDLPAWLNYLASARITQEMDDVWANICAYLDDAQMTEGVRGTGTWMPLGYDFNLSFGQYYIGDLDSGALSGLSAAEDWYKSHPLYGGWTIRARKSAGGAQMNGNNGFEAIYQSPKFRRLYLRRLRTLMDQELKEPGTPESDTPFMAKMREMADLMRADATLDKSKWPNDGTDVNIDVWKNTTRPANMDAGIDEIWNDYVIPRREHLYVTHSVTNTAKAVGYGSNLNAGIPEAQSPITTLAPNISVANLDNDGFFRSIELVVITNGNDEAVDMSGWRLAFGADFTFPAGTVCDANDYIFIVADRRAFIEDYYTDLTDEVIVGNATITGTGPIVLYDAAGTVVFSNIIATFLPGEHGTLSGDTVQQVEYNKAPVPPVPVPDDGWAFDSWDGGDVMAGMTGPATFTALWTVYLGDESLNTFYEWLESHGQLSDEQLAEVEASPEPIAAAQAIAQEMFTNCASGKSATLLAEFIAGTDPTDPDDSFTASISFDSDGNPVITPSTGLLSDDEVAMREYTTYGKTDLSVQDWTPITAPLQTKDFRFFKVSVRLR